MDEGWTRLVLEKFPDSVHHVNTTPRSRAGGLKDRIETLVIPSIDSDTLAKGYAEGQTGVPNTWGAWVWKGQQPLRAFVEAGGTIVCLENSCNYAIAEFALPVVNVLKGVKSTRFYALSSVVRVRPIWKYVADSRYRGTVRLL